MNTELLQNLANKFYEEMQSSSKLQGHNREHELRSQRARDLLTIDKIPNLTENELRELFFDSDAFSFWSNKEWEFNKRIQKLGLDGLRQVILELITRAENGLTPEDLNQIWEMRGLGVLLSTELIAYRFPERYWTFNDSVTLVALQVLGEDVKSSMPHGQKSNAYLYFAIKSLLNQVQQALNQAGFAANDYLLTDIFLWWIKTFKSELPDEVEEFIIPDVENSMIEQAMIDFDREKRDSSRWKGWESRKSYRYAIDWQGRYYPPKEIVRMATGTQDFVSSQARSYLSDKGYSVISLSSQTENVWIFQANPRIYDLINGLQREKFNDWQVTRYRFEVQPGDTVVLWKAGENRGIYGLAKIISSPYHSPDDDLVVDLEYIGRLNQPIYHQDIVDHPVLSKMHIMRQAQGTNFRITPEEWIVLEPMLGEVIPPDPDAEDVRAAGIKVPLDLLNVIGNSLKIQGLQFTSWQIATFYTALQTKGFVILSGISGTGKTKLAQHFASLLPRPSEQIQFSSDQIHITIQPYMLKYNRMIIPKASTRFFEPPKPGETQEITLTFNESSETCRLTHANYVDKDYVQLLLRGAARTWFTGSMQEGDTLILEPEFDTDSNLSGFQMIDLKISVENKGSQTQSGSENWLFIPVRPDWRDSKSLLGYYNPLTGTFEWTPFLRFLMQVVQSYRNNDGLAWFIILDEMNLARVEYYFADLLSILESGRDEYGWSNEPLRIVFPDDAEGDLPQKEIYLPPNFYVIGTVNVDETTHAFSPKVLDRSFTLELTEPDFSQYLMEEDFEEFIISGEERQQILDNFTFSGQFSHLDKQLIAAYIQEKEEYRSWLQILNDLLRPHELHFGYRIFDEIISFLISAEHNHLYDTIPEEMAAFDAAVLMKVLPKFHGSRSKLEMPLKAVLAWCLDPDAPSEQAISDVIKEGEENIFESLEQLSYKFPRTAERARRLLWSLYTTGFAAFG